MARTRCARRGCSKPIPKTAAVHGDPFCSSVCCRIAHGLSAEAPSSKRGERERKCAGCGIDLDEYTPGCRPCTARKRNRIKAGTLAA